MRPETWAAGGRGGDGVRGACTAVVRRGAGGGRPRRRCPFLTRPRRRAAGAAAPPPPRLPVCRMWLLPVGAKAAEEPRHCAQRSLVHVHATRSRCLDGCHYPPAAVPAGPPTSLPPRWEDGRPQGRWPGGRGGRGRSLGGGARGDTTASDAATLARAGGGAGEISTNPRGIPTTVGPAWPLTVRPRYLSSPRKDLAGRGRACAWCPCCKLFRIHTYRLYVVQKGPSFARNSIAWSDVFCMPTPSRCRPASDAWQERSFPAGHEAST